MKQRIELHDSVIDDLLIEKDQIVIIFNSFVILDVIDDFGFEFSKTSFKPGKITIFRPKYEALPSGGEVQGGYIGIGDCQYHMLPPDLSSSTRAILFIEQNGNFYKIFGQKISVFLN